MENGKQIPAYTRAGVDIDSMMQALKTARRRVRQTYTAGVRGGLGSFGGLFESPGKGSLLVSSIDGVGTKLKVAAMAGRHDTVGEDLVNHCVNDILVQGARPLFFMDYLGTSRLQGDVFDEVLQGLCRACRRNGCALLGGETAEMPGLYPPDEYDLVGAIVGFVDRKNLVTGESVRAGDVLLGLPSSGLHTNGYSLARNICFQQSGLRLNDNLPGTRRTVSRVLLAVHKSYLRPVQALQQQVAIRGMAHITGGGLVDNLPRMLPADCDALIDTASWRVPPVFRFLARAGGVETVEMFRVFNMGIGMVLAVRPKDAERSLQILRDAGERPKKIGQVIPGGKKTRLSPER